MEFPHWNEIKQEYISTDIKARELAEKWGVSYSRLTKRCAKEKWVEQRQKRGKYIADKITERTIEKSAENAVKQYDRFQDDVDLLLTKAEVAISQLEIDGFIDVDRMRKVAATLKDIKEMRGYKTEADAREQEARIRNLENHLVKDTQEAEPVRIIIEGADDFCV